MAAVRIKLPKDGPHEVYEHFIQRALEREFVASMAIELNDWLKTKPVAPDLMEAPSGWHIHFSSFTICGEGDCIKTLYAIYAPGKPRRNSIDLNDWE